MPQISVMQILFFIIIHQKRWTIKTKTPSGAYTLHNIDKNMCHLKRYKECTLKTLSNIIKLLHLLTILNIN